MLAAALVASAPLPSLAAEPSGQAVAVKPASAADGPGGSRVLTVAGPVFMGDHIRTDAAGEAQLKFVDDTRLVVGPNSQVTIDSFVFNPDTTAKAVTIDAARGVFRFITGKSPKQAYTIKTPAATIGVRGTRFDLVVEADGTNRIAIFEGGVEVCDTGTPRRCALLTGRCNVIVLTPDKQFQWVQNVDRRAVVLASRFPYAFNQGRLLPDFRVESAGCQFTSPNVVPPTHDNPSGPSEPSSPSQRDNGGPNEPGQGPGRL
jgi:hypothetical protein